MTERERAILAVLRAEPMIAQKDLAKRLGIERSSVGVHIANLMKKGHIQGKGYILNDSGHIVVVGGSNVDIVGSSDQLLKGDSALGQIAFSAGGVGRNIADAMARLDVPVKLLSAVGADVNGEWLLKVSREVGVDVSAVNVDPTRATGVYLAMLAGDGDMAYAINAMAITEAISPVYLQQHLGLLKHAKYVVADANLSEGALEMLTTSQVAPIIADPVSAIKAIKLKPHLSKFFGIKPNRLEAQVLTDIEIVDDASACHAVSVLLSAGIEQVVLSLGEGGVVIGSAAGIIKLQMPAVAVVNATGAGDVFTAAWVSGLAEGLPFQKCIQRAICAAAINVTSEQTIHPTLCVEQLQAYESEVVLNEIILRHPS